jgi:para-nitrobenzyl esterase
MHVNGVATTFILALALAAPAAAEPARTVVTLHSGMVRGAVSTSATGNILFFKGIPYAKAPLADLRWRSPRDVEPWAGVRDALVFAPDCAQTTTLLATARTEDCLFLNVWRPADKSASEPLPVMVWIHGGGYVNGGPSLAIHDGSALAGQGVLLVSISYRLGRLGFFAHPALVADPERPVGNYGYMDQIKALEWVQTNVAQFGGDARRVTLVGESAGGASVLALLTSPRLKDRELFHRAIIMSGGGRRALVSRPMADGTPQSAMVIDEAFAKSLDIDGPDALRALRKLSVERLVEGLDIKAVIDEAKSDRPAFSGTPMLDGDIVSAEPGTVLGQGGAAKVPLLIGTTALELPLFFPPKPDPFAYFGANADRARVIYGSLFPIYNIAIDMTMNEPARFAAKALTAAGNPAWLYRFSYVPEKTFVRLGARHSEEVPYFFQTLMPPPELTEQDRRVARAFSTYLTNFAKGLDPAAGGLPPWPRFDAAQSCLMDFALDGSFAVRSDPRKGIALVEQVAGGQPENVQASAETCH